MENLHHKLAFSVNDVTKLTGLSKYVVDDLVKTGKLLAIKCGPSRGKTIIPSWALKKFLQFENSDS
ncbi:MAG: hypothetical protein PHC60_07480 [Heliobacteriaceae bacterium]|nr:hypothetical protein [Heliobacteriaceae bacterium]